MSRVPRRRVVWGAILALVVSVLVAGAGLLLDELGVVGAIAQEQDTESDGLRSLPDERVTTGDVPAAPQELGGQPFLLCETCHPDFRERPTADEDLIFSHPVHMDQEIECVTCHSSPLGHFGQPAPRMMTCLSCHEGQTAPNECANCHRKLDEIAPGLDEPVVHLGTDVMDRETCVKCHEVESYCERCHGLMMPHPDGWTEEHGSVALRDSALCEKCHQSKDPTFCVDCHQLEMPHPPFWYSGHGDIASTNPDACVLCHQAAPQYCNSCHHAGWQPTDAWLPVEHGAAVAQDGTERCFVCHEQSFCEQCHRAGRFVK